MPKGIVAGLAAACALAVAAPAGATTYVLHATGVIDDPVNPATGLAQGQTVTFDATFEDINLLPGPTSGTYRGYTFTQASGPPGPFHGTKAPFTIATGPWAWVANFDLNAGFLPVWYNFSLGGQTYTYLNPNYAYPPGSDFHPEMERIVYESRNVIFSPTAVVGIYGIGLWNWTSATQPVITSNGSTFSFVSVNGAAFTGQVTGHWDLANAAVTVLGGAVPEPSSWAMLILGFGGVGLMMRRRTRAAAA